MNGPAWNHRHLETNGIGIHYVRHGVGPPLVLLHGWSEFWYTWRKNLPVLAREFDVVAPDLRGFGDTNKPVLPDPPKSLLGTLVEDLRGLVDSLGFERFGVVSHRGRLRGAGVRPEVPGAFQRPDLANREISDSFGTIA
jgi:pimeloyl-ACP methyl ester carboxylesterase